MNIAELYTLYEKHPHIQTDSRKIKENDLYFALKGPHFNGNQFAENALASGAAYAITDEATGREDEKIILVNDVLKTLQDLAAYHRDRFSIPFIGITGSNGKTTTKELIHAVLSRHYVTYTTEGNLNNHIGIPLTILKIKKDAQIAVIEMGANHLGEIAGYCLYAKPDVGIITNCGKAHLEGFGSEAGVRQGKGELFDYLRQTDGRCFAYGDYPYFETMIRGIKEINWYSSENPAPKPDGKLWAKGRIALSESFLEIKLEGKEALVKTQLVGGYNLPNVLCAIAVGRYFNVPENQIMEAIEGYTPSNSRSQLIKAGSNDIILDAYNANPSSMKVAIENLAQMQGKEKVLVLGGMKELGTESEAEHQKLLNLLGQYNWKEVVLVGAEFEKIHGAYRWFASNKEAAGWFQRQAFEGAVILIKGSRSNALEKILGTN